MTGEGEPREGERIVFAASTGGEGPQELSRVLEAVDKFLAGLSQHLGRLLDTLLGSIDGRRVGEEVAAFYRSLREAGMPEDVAAEMTREYFRKRMVTADALAKLGDIIKREISGEEEEEGES
ncbi:MAG: hypothetical protein LRS49_06395 [Desulfurococcales archaeon]|nr:hypothetical protein [Desulfurococcales archaeon]